MMVSTCPICFEGFPSSVLERHASECTGKKEKAPTPSRMGRAPSGHEGRKRGRDPDDSSTSSSKVSRALEAQTCDQDRSQRIPLAERMRPEDLEHYLGQDSALSGTFRNLIEKNRVPSLIFWGPPGCGKTTLAHIIAHRCKAQGNGTRFVKLSAVTSGVSDVKKVVEVAKNDHQMLKRSTILFIDEIHRFNKLQQDAFLPHVENGTVTLLGATTENPSFSLNKALLSRCKVIPLETLQPETIEKILRNALKKSGIDCNGDALEFLSNCANGDARMALNCLQIAAESGASPITLESIKSSLNRTHILYDRKGDEHYHCASALQKSIRGSDDNAALYWCIRMLQGGEDPLFIARRLVRIAAEDVGLADPHALTMAVSAMQGCQLIGMPECNLILAECCTYLARAKKSHELLWATGKVMESLNSCEGNLPAVPLHLRNATSGFEKQLGYGKGYSYNLEEVTKINYLPDEIKEPFFPTSSESRKK